MQPWHEKRGAKPLVAGAWIRPDHYGDPASEVLNVRENVGIIDVTPLGKFDLRGPEVPRLLDHLYINRWDNLEVGAVRYGVMCLEDGVVFDDGVTGCLGPERYIMTTTSSGAAGVWEWIDLWLQTAHPGWQIHVTPVTTAYASINVAGPKSRELLLRLTPSGICGSAPDVSLAWMTVSCGASASQASSATRSTCLPPTGYTCGRRSCRAALTSALGRSA
jgi:sarcosine oxidase subunit alpha